MLFVLFAGCYKVVKPDIESTLKDDYVSDDKDGDGFYVQLPAMLRMAEVTTESYPQSVLGEQSAPSVFNYRSILILSPGIYIQLMIGPTEDETARAFQYIGIAASLLSITKGCGEWWTRSR